MKTEVVMQNDFQKWPIPTGYLFADRYSKGRLETLSIGDYGKPFNVKADFLGYTKDIDGVPNTHCMPLSEKWVVTVSTQYGCPMRCTFCDVPNVEWQGNATFDDLKAQLYRAISLFPGTPYTERLNLHYARMGDPIFNQAVFDFARWMYANKRQMAEETGLRIEVIHPVLTTSLPRKFRSLEERIMQWCEIKNEVYNGQCGFQFSINSTSEDQRSEMFRGMQLPLADFSKIADRMPYPQSRKYCLNFAFSTDFIIDARVVADLFDSKKFMCKITPIHNNNACREAGINTADGYTSFRPYRQPEEDLKTAGFDVLVFVPSIDEEDGLVTCGNAILGGSTLKRDDGVIKITGLEPNYAHSEYVRHELPDW
jgi:23S rRNA (adenine2503-C2)-methyltransferase